MDYHLMSSPCGLDCFNCPMYLATMDEQIRVSVGEELGLPSDKVQCRGCRNEGGLIAFQGMSEPCPIYACSNGRNHEFCSDCDDFPCDLLHPLAEPKEMVPCNIKTFNLCLIKRMGVEKWAKEKSRRVRQTYYQTISKYGL